MASKHVSLLSAFLEWDLTEWFKRFEMELQPVSEASVQVVSATGEPIPVLGLVTLSVQVGPIEVDHRLVVVQSLITPVILGITWPYLGLHHHSGACYHTTYLREQPEGKCSARSL